MGRCEEYIDYVDRELPKMATTKDLIRVGIYRTDQAAAKARRKKLGPEFFQLNQRVVLYPKAAVIDFLTERKCPMQGIQDEPIIDQND